MYSSKENVTLTINGKRVRVNVYYFAIQLFPAIFFYGWCGVCLDLASALNVYMEIPNKS